MEPCKDLIHPFQNDPGVSQRQRIVDELLSGEAKIDGRTLADLLDYFVQLSRHINYYDSDLSISDWQPFFQKSTPFTLATISKYKQQEAAEKPALYQKLFLRRPTSSGLQLLVHYVFHGILLKLNNWHLQVQGSGLPVAFALEQLIKDKLRYPLKELIAYSNAAVKWYCIKPVNWHQLSENEVWELEITDLYTSDVSFKSKGTTSTERLVALYTSVYELVPAFLDVTGIVAGAAALSIEQSLEPLAEELKQKHAPHLALLFAFLKLFRYLQDDLNSFTKKHLDFFYKQVLHLKAKEATPDKTHLVFEIQNNLETYLLQKGLLVKDGKDKNKAEVYFALDDELVVNKTQITDKRTLFLNNQTVYDTTYVEGVYVAPDATEADGLEEDFKDDAPNSFYTLGAKYSKFTDPEHKYNKPYPNAHLGFILASPVLLLNEGTRTITITLNCELTPDICESFSLSTGTSENCCEDNSGQILLATDAGAYPEFERADKFYARVRDVLGTTYYYISQELIAQAKKKGVGEAITDKLKQLLTEENKLCYCPTNEIKYDRIIPATAPAGLGFEDKFSAGERLILEEFFRPRKALNVLFSGEKAWLSPNVPATISITPLLLPASKTFTLTIEAILTADQPAVTFYNPENLSEDFNTTLPLVKIELDDKIKLDHEIDMQEAACCLEKVLTDTDLPVSLYHFFRNVTVKETSKIDVKVCGLKNVIVQNDESLQDVNSPIYPFGTRPKRDANFYIGSSEIFSKNWVDVHVNVNWKNKPANFEDYYTAYQHMFQMVTEGVIKDNNYKADLAVLKNGTWHPAPFGGCDDSGVNANNLLFSDIAAGDPAICAATPAKFGYAWKVSRADFAGLPAYKPTKTCYGISRLNAATADCFMRIRLRCQDFQHDRYAFILARQMMAFGRLPNDLVAGAYYRDNPSNAILVFNDIGTIVNDLDTDISTLQTDAATTKDKTEDTITEAEVAGGVTGAGEPVANAAHAADTAAQDTIDAADDVHDTFEQMKITVPFFSFLNPVNRNRLEAVIPNEPWTPVIKEISLDYTATATITDIDLIHLYPYKGTHKHEEIELQPTLLPVFCDEGTLFLGLQDLKPGSNLNILFQLAEATAASESKRAEVRWAYLANNYWKVLRPGFEVLDDATHDLTTSGIIKLAVPANITNDNTILPQGLHWLKASIPQNSRSASETIGIHTQAIQVTFTNEDTNDKLRLEQPLPAGSIAKLQVADAAIKKVEQPYDSFGGRIPEAEGHFYVRTSELLRHKNRAIQKYDYERLVLEAFPKIYKAKCINHSFALDANRYINDLPMAPGYVLLAVIPDLNKLNAAQTFEPRVPVSLLDAIQAYLAQRTSPFVRLRIMNPRYEKIHFCLKVKLYLGKDENYYTKKLTQDLKEFLAPWAVGQYDKLTFGQCIYRSDIVHFLETRDYLDYILELIYWHEADAKPVKSGPAYSENVLLPVCPKTPRSILIAGEIDVCIQQQDCETWKEDESCNHPPLPLTDYCTDIV